MILTVDPGLRGCGCAAWASDGTLIRAGYAPGTLADDPVEHVASVTAHAVLLFMHDAQPRHEAITSIIVERPQTYRGRAAKGDANDLLDVTLVVGCILGKLPSAVLVRPSEWKGQTPKHATEARARKKLGELVARVDLSCGKKLAPNVWDAVGIGLWYIGRRQQPG